MKKGQVVQIVTGAHKEELAVILAVRGENLTVQLEDSKKIIYKKSAVIEA